MQIVVVAAKPGAEQPWLADGAAQLARETGAGVAVVSLDGVDIEALSPVPRTESQVPAREAAEALAERIRQAGVTEVTAEVRPGRAVPGVLLYAEERDADLIVCGASRRSAAAQRLLGSVSLELVRRSRRPVLVLSPPA